MSKRFDAISDALEAYRNAERYAQGEANYLGMDVAIRRVKEFGRDGFNVSIASRNDSDYARAEIVRPQVTVLAPDDKCTTWSVVTAGPGRHLLAYRPTRDEALMFARNFNAQRDVMAE